MDSKSFQYVIKSGDYLSKIASKYHTTVNDILKLNPNIKDPNKIFAGASLKLPKISGQNTPPEYKQALNLGIKNLYLGKYGREGAREKLLKELEHCYPEVDVASDIYTKIPDNWEKKSLPGPKIKEIEQNDKKKAWYNKISDFLSDKVIKPLKPKVQEAVYDVADYVNELPDSNQLLKLAGEKTKSIVNSLSSYWKKKSKPLPEIKVPKVEEEPIKPLPKAPDIEPSLDKIIDKCKRSTIDLIDQQNPDYVPVESISTPSNLMPMKFPTSFKISKEGKFERPLTDEERMRVDPTYAAQKIKILQDDLNKALESAKARGVAFTYDNNGHITNLDEKRTKVNIQNLVDQKIKSLTELPPLLTEANRRAEENNELQNKIIKSLSEEMDKISDFLNKPENLDSEKLVKFSKGLQDKFGTSKELKELDSSLTDYQDFKKTEGDFIKTASDYERKASEIQKELDNLVTPDIDKFFDEQSNLEKLSNDRIKELQSYYNKHKSKIDRIISLSQQLREISNWSEVNAARLKNIKNRADILSSGITGKLKNIVNYIQSPDFIEGLNEYSLKAANPQSDLLKYVKAFQKNKLWLKEYEDEIKKQTLELDKKRKAIQQDINGYVSEVSNSTDNLFNLIQKLNKAKKDYLRAVVHNDFIAWEHGRDLINNFLKRTDISYWKKDKFKNFFSKETWIKSVPFLWEGVKKTPPVKQGLQALNWWNIEVFQKNILPFEETYTTEIITGLSYLGYKLGTVIYFPKMTKEEHEYWGDEDWVPYMEMMKTWFKLPTKELRASQDLLDFHLRLLDSYKHPSMYEDLIFSREVSIEELIPKDRDILFSDIQSLNPSIKDLYHIPPNTRIRVPRFDPLPKWTDLLPPEKRRIWDIKYPVRMTVAEMSGEMITDPMNVFWDSAMMGATRLANFTKLKAYNKLTNLASKYEWASKMQDYFDFTTELGRFMTMREVSEDFAAKVPTLDRFRSTYMGLSIAKYLPYGARIEANKTQSVLSQTNKSLISAEVADAIKTVGKKYKVAPKLLEKELRRYLSEPWKRPSERAIAVLQRLDLTPHDIWELAQKYPTAEPILEDVVRTHLLSKPKAEYLADILNKDLQESSDLTRAVFNSIRKARSPKAVKEVKNYYKTAFADNIDEVERGFELWANYEEETDKWLRLYQSSKEIIKVPEGFRIAAVDRKSRYLLEGSRYKIFEHKGLLNFLYDPEAYKAGRLGEVIEDFTASIAEARLNNLRNITAYTLDTYFPETKFEAIHPPSKKKFRVIYPGQHSYKRGQSYLDALVTDYMDNFYPKLTKYQRGELNEILRKLAPDEKVQVEFRYTFKKPWEDMIAERAKEGRASYFEKTNQMQEVITRYKTVETYLKEAAGLETFRRLNPDLLKDYKKILDRLPEDNLTPLLSLQKFILNLPEDRRLTETQMLLLVGDDLTSYQKAFLLKKIQLLGRSRAYKYNQKTRLSKKLALEKKHDVNPKDIWKELQDINTKVIWNRDSIEDLAKLKNYSALKTKTVELERILPRRFHYLANVSLEGKEKEALITKIQGEMREKTIKRLKDLETAKGSNINKILASLNNDIKTMQDHLMPLLSTPNDSAKVSVEEQRAIMAAYNKHYLIQVYDITPKDKAFIRYLETHDIPFQTLHVPKLDTPKDVASQLDKLGIRPWITPKKVISDDGLLKVMAQKFKWPSTKELTTPVEWDDFYRKFDSFYRVLVQELKKSPEGRRWLNNLWTKKIAINFPDSLAEANQEILSMKGLLANPKKMRAMGETAAGLTTRISDFRAYMDDVEDFVRGWNDRANVTANILGFKALRVTETSSGKIAKIEAIRDFEKGQAFLQEAALRQNGVKHWIGTLIPEVRKRLFEPPHLSKEISFDTQEFLKRLINATNVSCYKDPKTWRKAWFKQKKLKYLRIRSKDLESELDKNEKALRTLRARLEEINNLPNLKRQLSEESLDPKSVKSLSNRIKAIEKFATKKTLLAKQEKTLSQKIQDLISESVEIDKKIRASEDTIDGFLSALGAKDTVLLDQEENIIRAMQAKAPLSSSFIEDIDRRISTLETLLNQPKMIVRMKESPAKFQLEIKRLKNLREIAVPYQVALNHHLLPTGEELWYASKGHITSDFQVKLKKLSSLLAPKANLKGTPLLLSEFKNLKSRVPEITIKGRSLDSLTKEFMVGDILDSKGVLPEIKTWTPESAFNPSLPQLKLDSDSTYKALKEAKKAYVVKNYKMGTNDFWINKIGRCKSKLLKEAKSPSDLEPYLALSGYSSANDWWKQIRRYSYKKDLGPLEFLSPGISPKDLKLEGPKILSDSKSLAKKFGVEFGPEDYKSIAKGNMSSGLIDKIRLLVSRAREDEENLKPLLKLYVKSSSEDLKSKGPVILSNFNSLARRFKVEFSPEDFKSISQGNLTSNLLEKINRIRSSSAKLGPKSYWIYEINQKATPINSETLFQALRRFDKDGIKVVIDQTGLLTTEPFSNYKFNFKIIDFKRLFPGKLTWLSNHPGEIASETEVKGMQELRKIFWDSKKIAIVGSGDLPNKITKTFYSRYLTRLEKSFLEAAKKDFRDFIELARGKAHPGYTFLYPYNKYKGVEWTKELTPVETIKKIRPQYEREYTLHEARNFLQKSKWLDQKILDENPFKESKILLISSDNINLDSSFRKALDDAIKGNSKFFVPKIPNKGEKVIIDILNKKHIPYTKLSFNGKTIEKIYQGTNNDLPYFVLPNLPTTRDLRGTRFNILRALQKRNRMFKSFEVMKKEAIDDFMDAIARWKKDIDKLPPEFIRQELKKFGDVRTALSKWIMLGERKEAKEAWMKEKELVVKNFEENLRNEMMKVSKRNYLLESEKKAVALQVSRLKHTLEGLDQNVFKWDRGLTWLERMRREVARKLEFSYFKNADSYGLGALPVEQDKIKRAKLIIENKLFWDVPHFMGIPKTIAQTARTVWVNTVLFWRAGWYVWNTLDDGLRLSLASKNIGDFFRVQAAYTDVTLKFLREWGGDYVKLILEQTGFYKLAPKLEREAMRFLPPRLAADVSWEIERTVQHGSFKVFNIENYYKAKKTGIFGNLTEKLYRSAIRDTLRWKDASTVLPSGEVMLPRDVDFLASQGLYSTVGDPLATTKILNMIDETAWGQRVLKRFAIIDADLKLYASATEDLRRLLCAHSLLFGKAMKLAEAEAKVKKYLFDYQDLSLAGRLFRNFFPFYTFNAKAIKLYLDISLKEGYRTYVASKTLLKAWSMVTKDLPEYYQNRIKVGHEIYWSPHFSVIDFLQLIKDPVRTIQEFLDNPLRAFDFGWDPFLASLIEKAQGKGYWDLSPYLKNTRGWTQWEIEQRLKEYKIKTTDYSKAPGKAVEFMLQFVPIAPAIKALTEVDEAFAMREIPLMNSKVIREWLKFFGLNIRKYNDLERLRNVYFDLPPHMRTQWVKDLKEENPDLYKIWREYFLISGIVKISNAKGKDKYDLIKKAEKQWYIDAFYSLEDAHKGAGYDWLKKNKRAQKYLDEHWKGLELTPWRLASKDEHDKDVLKSILKTYLKDIPSSMTDEKIAKLKILGIDNIYTKAFDKNDLRNDFFYHNGDLKPLSIEEANTILKDNHWIEKGLKEIGPATIKKANELLLEWKALDREAREKGRLKDALYYHHLSIIFEVLPSNIEDLPEKEQAKYWEEWRKTFDRILTDDEKVRYAKDLPEIQRKYLEAMQDYIKRWKDIFSRFKEENFDFFKAFYSQPKWFRDLYFLKHKDRAVWYSFAQKWISMLQAIKAEEKKSNIFLKEERKKASEFFWAPENKIAREAWDRNNPGFLQYMEAWKKIFTVTESVPDKYFDLFYSQPQWFQDRFFKANPDKKLYYSFIRRWIELSKIDKKNAKKGIKTKLAETWFWSKNNKKAREAYGKANMITKDKSILDYLKKWQEVIKVTEENPNQYFPFFYSQPNWFTQHFFKNNPNKAIYYPFVRTWVKLIEEDQKISKETGKRSTKASDYFWKDSKEARIARRLYEKDNPGILNYLKTWEVIIEKTEKNPEAYFDLFYKQSKAFQERFFHNNPDKKTYYTFLREWIKLLDLDKKNWEEKHKRTSLASEWFWSKKFEKARQLYAKNNMITKTKSILDYLRIWEEVRKQTEENPKAFFAVFDKQSQWFKNHYFSNHPERKIYYPFARKLGQQKPEDFGSFFWSSKYKKEREAWAKDNPDFMAYMRFWKQLSNYAKIGNWDAYFKYYFSNENEKYRLRHWRNHPEAKKRYLAFREYSLMPAITWEDKRARSQFLKSHPELLEWWRENLSEKDAEIRSKVEHYFDLLNNIKPDGAGRDYFLNYRKWKAAADKYLEQNPEVLLFLERKPRHYTGYKAEIFDLISSYNSLTFPSERQTFLKDHPELSSYFLSNNPPGIRRILKIQSQYFKLPDSEKKAFLEAHPELKEWWEIKKLPWSYFFAPKKFRSFENAVNKVNKFFSSYKSGDWVKAESLRKSLPDIYKDPGSSKEDEWFKNKIYKLAMETWSKVIDHNEFIAIYYFRQLPRWIRDQYYSKHPEKLYLSTYPLSRFIEEPLRIWANLNPDLAWAFREHYKYGKNMPWKIKERVKNIFIKNGIWKSRSNWTRADWENFWRARTLELNEATQFDYNHIPLFRSELEKVVHTFPLRLNPKPFSKPRIGTIHPFF